MDDKGRSLEHLAQQVKRIALVEVQKCFLAGKIDLGANLMSQWEQYLELSKIEPVDIQGHETLSVTLKRLSKRLRALQNVLNGLPKQQCVSELQEKANTLEERFASTKVGVGGGTFEWVDSVLVKCLREGCWLAVDNVNLCSSAVLDRLNGLLEPGGELVVGERGVDADGRLVTIKPHPDFRLFLIMNPNHGEISRAMRNRGVEICLLGPEENKMQFMDLQAILSRMGIFHYNRQKALMNIHEQVKNVSIGVESVTLNHLLQVASLTQQQVLRGQSFYEALRLACGDVYVQGRQLTFDHRQRCTSLLDEIIDSQKPILELKSDVRDVLDVRTSTLSTLDLQENSSFALLQQRCALLSSALRLSATSENHSLKDLLKDDLEKAKLSEQFFDKDMKNLLPQILVTSLCCLSENHLSTKRSYILTKVMSCKDTDVRNKLSELEKFLTSTVLQAIKKEKFNSIEGVNRKDLCWDLRRVSSWLLDHEKFDSENKTIALLYYFKQYLQVGVKLGEVDNKSVKKMSALDFSTSYNKGQVTIASVRSQVILELSLFLESLEDQVHQLLDSRGWQLDETQCCQLISAFHWGHRLAQVARRKLFVSRSREMEVEKELLMLLSLHVHWVKKYLLPRLPLDMLKRGEMMWTLCSSSSLSQPVRSLSRRVRVLKGQPLPLSNRLQGKVLETVHRLENMIDLTFPDEHNKDLVLRRVEFLLSPEGKYTRFKLAQLIESIGQTDGLENVLEELGILEATLVKSKLNQNSSERMGESELLKNSTWEVSLWPIRAAVCLYLMAAVGNNETDQLTDALHSWLKSVPLFLPSLLARSPQPKQLSLPATARLWLTWDQVLQSENLNSESDEITLSKKETYPLHCPVLSLFITALLYPGCHDSSDHSLAVPPLRSYKQHARMLATLAEVVWNCIPSLASTSLDYRKNETETVIKLYESFLQKTEAAVDLKHNKIGLLPHERNFLVLLKDILKFKMIKEDIKSLGLGTEAESLLFDLSRYLQSFEQILDKMVSSGCADGNAEGLLLTGQAWAVLGLMEFTLFSHQDQVDPVQRKALKLKYTEDEIDELESILAVEEAQALIIGARHFPLQVPFTQRLSTVRDQELRLRKYVAERPEPNVYTNLYSEIQQLMVLLVRGGSSQRVEATVASLQACVCEANSKTIQEAVARAESLLTSLHMSVDTLSKRYGIWYPDVVVPVVSAISQISHGLSLMVGAVKKFVANQPIPVEPLMKALVRFPLPDCAAALHLVDMCTDVRTLEVIVAAVTPKLKEGETVSNETFRLAKCSLEEVMNMVSVRGSLTRDEISCVGVILDHLVAAWRKQQQEKELKEQQEGKFFINKPRKPENLTEEEEDAIEMRKLFPSYRDKDFADLEPPSLEQKKPAESDDTNLDSNLKLSLENILDIHRIHSAIVTKHTRTHWATPVEPEQPNFTSSFMERLTLFSVLLNAQYAGCDNSLDPELAPAMSLSIYLAANHGSVGSCSRRHYDFYHDANINEVKLCIPIVESLKRRVKELLGEWPDHPTLNQIMMVIGRVELFPSHSPVSRFLVGLELLLTKLKEWEENAHAGVTLAPHAHVVTRQILDWRKLELSQWKGCFESARMRLCDGVVTKWWFHLYSLVQESDDAGQLAPVLEQFMETSCLGEYQTRLDLLFTFHFHCFNNGQKLQANIFWNVHQYYAQFNRVIQRRIKDLSQPVEKKLKDFVKIARWNDINYWAVKETVDKTHRTLFKYIREYEAVLKQPATSAMTRLDPVSGQGKVVTVNASLYVAPVLAIENASPDSEEVNSNDAIEKERSLFSRARKLCRDSVANCPLPRNISALQQVVELLQEVGQLLNTEDVDRTLSKERQRSAARSVLHRKRASLTDVFHRLADLGLSYRTGLVVGSKSLVDTFTQHQPLNVMAGLAQIDSRSADKELAAAWRGCDEHFLHSVAYLSQLRAALAKPHKDLGPAIVDRCKGFTNHLMGMCHDQKKNICESVTSLFVLRCLIQELNFIKTNSKDVYISDLDKLKDDMVSLLEDIIFCALQFHLLIETCPEAQDVIVIDETVTTVIPDCVETIVFKGDEHWSRVKTKLTSVTKSARKCKSLIEEKGKYTLFLKNFQKTCESEDFEVVSCFEDLNTLQTGCANLIDIKKDLNGIIEVFRMRNANDINPVVRCWIDVQQKIDKYLEWFNHQLAETEKLKSTGSEITQDGRTVQTLLNKVLYSIQEYYKSVVQKPENSEQTSEKQESEDEDKLYENHLKETILNVLKKEQDILKLSEITRDVQRLHVQCIGDGPSRWRLKQCVPLLQQYSLLAQFVITQQISALHSSAQLCSSLLTLFVDLAIKGFRIPEELLEEEDGEGTETTKGGMGLGEGEGQKDVSEEIESQDQLEDAKKPGEHEQEEEKDCKEEEKGIEMSDDFGGKLQDVERKEDEDGSGEDSDEEEPDKEMGDTDKGAETLDQQIWGGSDLEDEEEESEELEEEQGDRGEQTGEKQMGAKDDEKTPQGGDNDEDSGEQKNDKQKEINEMEEPEVDDDQIDPYHGNNQPPPEPEPLDLPDDLQLDDGEGKDKEDEGEEDNPFDIDAMKEPKLPEDKEGDEETEETEKDPEKDKQPEEDSSDEEEEGGGGESQEVEAMDVDEQENKEDQKGDEDGGSKDENKTGEEPKIDEEEKKEEEEAKPSEDLPASEAVPSAQQQTGSKDQVKQAETSEKSKELNPEESAAEGPEEQGVGAAQQDQREAEAGGRGESSQAVPSSTQQTREEKRERPGESEEQRTLGDVQEPLKKKLKTINMERQNETTDRRTEEEGIKEDESAEMYQHIKEAKQNQYDAQTMDAATEEQAAEQKLPNKEDEEAEPLQDDKDMTLDQDEPADTDQVTSVNPEKLREANDQKQDGVQQPAADGERVEGEAKMEVEGEVVETETVQRGAESWYHTNMSEETDLGIAEVDVDGIRRELEQQLASWSQPPAAGEAVVAWERLCGVTADLSRELSEQLRLVLEPTHASRLQGDYRTGRRINMRKVIPYIASQFRKDKIWLRRSKPAKREYQIVLAIDDSSSMADNHSKELAFESLAVVSKALSLLEAGQLAVLSFGETPKVLHQLGDPFTEHSGARLLQQFSFEQQKTQVGALVNFAVSLFEKVPARRGVTDIAQLLVIVSDGRGVMNDGEEVVRQAVRRAKHSGVFMVFVIVDNPQSKDSILDIRLPKFSGGKLVGIVPYMDSFPFPFYLILRDINSLPSVLSDALRQWFELVTSTS
ncbi:midasin-like isoform X1 [Macrosteles quadrilineatus]|uniref:midasin-like isoform X1 n=1 Tax=Macrosteles quadrilineatus TaxID=74068 RepID=UPI0023E221F4|nr:midasin-like isoform X1 [Macrosteles quadrilineatus]